MLTMFRITTLFIFLVGLSGCPHDVQSSDNCKGQTNKRCCRIDTGNGNYTSFCSTETECDAQAGNREHLWPADNIVSPDTAGCRAR